MGFLGFLLLKEYIEEGKTEREMWRRCWAALGLLALFIALTSICCYGLHLLTNWLQLVKF